MLARVTIIIMKIYLQPLNSILRHFVSPIAITFLAKLDHILWRKRFLTQKLSVIYRAQPLWLLVSSVSHAASCSGETNATQSMVVYIATEPMNHQPLTNLTRQGDRGGHRWRREKESVTRGQEAGTRGISDSDWLFVTL